MPGLSQIKKFSSDLLAIGDEVTIRASRGEKPVAVPIPKTVEDINDSEDFVLGMPEIEAEKPAEADEDLSELAGLVGNSASKSDNSTEPAPAFMAPDLSSLVNPINLSNNESNGGEMPDLSEFMDESEKHPEIAPIEPKEISVGDMDLEALLSGGGFDQGEETEKSEEKAPETDSFETENLFGIDNNEKKSLADEILKNDESENLGENLEKSAEDEDSGTDYSDFGTDFDSSLLDFDSKKSDENFGAEDFDSSVLDSVPSDDFSDLLIPAEDDEKQNKTDDDSDATTDDFEKTEDFSDDGNSSADSDFDIDTKTPEGLFNLDDFEIPDSDSFENVPEGGDFDFSLGDPSKNSQNYSEEFDGGQEADAVTQDIDDIPVTDFSVKDSDNGQNTSGLTEDIDNGHKTDSSGDDFDIGGLEDLPDMDEPLDFGSEDKKSDFTGDVFADLEKVSENKNDGEKKSASGEETGGLEDFGISEESSNEKTEDDNFDFEKEDFDSDEDEFDFEESNSDADFTFDEGDSDTENQEVPEVFDISDMEGMDFGIQDTDSAMNSSASDDNFDDSDNNGDFEIAGFTDVESEESSKNKNHKEKKSQNKTKTDGISLSFDEENLDEADFTSAIEGDELPPNTLSDAQYKIFRKNLSEYPLNVRLAIENLIVQDEFTDDAEFEVIEKVLNKAPARSVASMLEKMLDTSIPVPRDYEHRSAEEYEAYKKSVSYQLRNRIIPAFIFGVAALLVCWGIFNFAKNCIYKPLRASSYYKQGYTLLQADEYPQSEMKFNQAIKYRLSKKWFFKYARGYREHKQYQRSADMYQKILYCFNHDKKAGLEYADMELNDLANYERAEEIVRREVLDYHINDVDGILMLGDVFLEWGTEKEDKEKLEEAKTQYVTLIQLNKNKSNDLYNSRMMRYYIRTDNLRQVLNIRQSFDGREKSLGWQDWTELSGYLLDKAYGTLSPAEEYLRTAIDGLRSLLLVAVKSNPHNPVAQYNLARYFIFTNEVENVESTLQKAIQNFNDTEILKTRDIYKYIDSYRLLGEHYAGKTEYLQAQEQYAEGISLYTTERDYAGFRGNAQVGKLYEDLGNIKYFVSGDYDDALTNYKESIELENDTPQIRYRVGYIQYKNKNYAEALASFMKAGEAREKPENLLLSMANTLSLRGDDYAAQGYYENLMNRLNDERSEGLYSKPQSSKKDNNFVTQYLYAANNYGVTLYRLAQRTGNSMYNAQSFVQFQESAKAWDALTRNQETLVRLEGSNLAQENIKYITHPQPNFEPAIYVEIPKTLQDNEF